MEIIQSITERSFPYEYEPRFMTPEEAMSVPAAGGNGTDGFEIVTSEQVIALMIDMRTGCCETPGYFMTNDDIQEFIGAELRSVTLTDTALNTIKSIPDVGYDGGIVFVNLTTNRGVLQFVAYNQQNGYYSHDVRIRSKQLRTDISV